MLSFVCFPDPWPSLPVVRPASFSSAVLPVLSPRCSDACAALSGNWGKRRQTFFSTDEGAHLSSSSGAGCRAEGSQRSFRNSGSHSAVQEALLALLRHLTAAVPKRLYLSQNRHPCGCFAAFAQEMEQALALSRFSAEREFVSHFARKFDLLKKKVRTLRQQRSFLKKTSQNKLSKQPHKFSALKAFQLSTTSSSPGRRKWALLWLCSNQSLPTPTARSSFALTRTFMNER